MTSGFVNLLLLLEDISRIAWAHSCQGHYFKKWVFTSWPVFYNIKYYINEIDYRN